MAQFVGTVSKLTGVAHARAEDGTMRELRLGDDVYQGEVLVTARGTVVQVSVPDAPSIVLPGERELLLNGEVTVASSNSSDESVLDDATLDSLVAALESGEGDLLDGLEATAAGAGNEGSSFVRLGRIGFGLSEFTELTSPNDTTDQELSSSEFDPDLALLQTDDDVEIEIPEPEPEPEPEPPVNASPDAIDDTFSGEFGAELQGNVLPNDTDPEGDALTVTGNSQPANGEVLVNADGSFTYLPNPGFSGSDSFTYTISDGNGGTDTATVNITVAEAPNNAPDAVNDAVATAFQTPVNGSVLPNDSDPDGDTLTISSNTQPANGSLVFNADGTFTYTPSDGFSGDDTFTYTVTDGNGGTDTATVTISVAEEPVAPPPPPVNQSPDAVNDAVATAFQTPVNGSVLPNDSDPDGDTLTISSNTQPANGSLVFNADGTFTYTPSDGFSGDDTFTYTVTDGNGGTDTATVTISVAEEDVNTPPVATNDTQSTGENSAVTISILANDTDADGALDPVSVTIVSGPSNGSVTVNADGTVTYTPSDDYIGADLFTYTVADDDGDVSNIASVNISVDNTRNVSSFTDNWVDGVEYFSYASEADYINGLDPVVSGLTGDQGSPGSFSWDDGEFIVFKIGAVIVGEFSATQLAGEILFIHDIAGLALSNTNADQLENTAIFLQALDTDLTDGDLSDGLQTNGQLNSDAAFATGITISAETREAFSDYEDPTTGEPLDLQTAGKGMISDALATQGIEFTRQSESDPDLSDGSQNVFETQAIGHITDTVLALADTEAAGERLADDFAFDAREEDVIVAGNGFIEYSSEFITTGDDNAETAKLAFDARGLLANATPQQVAIRENMDIEIPEGTLAQITLADGTTRVVGEVVYDDDNRTGYIQLTDYDGITGITDQEIDDGLLETVSFEYTIWDWTARETVSLTTLDTYKANLSAEITNVVEGEIIEFTLQSSLTFDADQQLTLKISPEGNGFNFAEYADDFTVPIEYSTDGGATWQPMLQVDSYFAPPYDLPLPVFSFTLPAGSDSILVRIETFDDVFDEDPAGSIDGASGQGIEVIDMTIEGQNFYTKNLQPGIIDNDPPTNPYIKSDFVIVYEDAGEAVFTITLYDSNGNPVIATENITVNYSTTDLGAVAGEDYTAVSGTVTIIAGQSTATVSVPIIDDDIIEIPDPEFALLTLDETSITGNYGGTAVVVGDKQGSLRIYDNDAGVFSVNDVTVVEGDEVNGEKGVLVTVVRTGAGPADANQTVILSTLALSNSDSAQAEDFTATTNITVTFAPGETTQTVFIPIIDDAVLESPETFRVELSSPTGGASIAAGIRGQTPDGIGTVTILDNDAPNVVIADAAVEEGSSAIFNVTITQSSDSPVDMKFSATVVVGNTAETSDFDAENLIVVYLNEGNETVIGVNGDGTFTVPAGVTALTVKVPTTDDDIFEGRETFTLTASTANVNYTADDTGLGTIFDDGSQPDGDDPDGESDNDLPSISIEVSPAVVNEGDANETDAMTYTVTLDGTSAQVTLATITLSGSASTSDYLVKDASGETVTPDVNGSFNLTVLAGETSATFSVDPVGDTVFEGQESVTATVTATTTDTAGTSYALPVTQGASLVATGNIVDDGTGPDPDGDGPETPDDDKTSFSVDSVSVSEGGLMTFTVTRTGDAEADQTVDFATSIEAGDSAEADDFASATGTLTFAAGETSKTFTVQSTADNVYEGAETFTVTLSNNSAGSTISQATGTGTILDDGTGPDPDGPEGPETPDDDRPVVSISGPTSVDEDAGTVTYTISLSNASTESVSVDYASADVTAEAGSDYTASSGTVTFAAGETEKTVTVAITDDDVDESDEDYTVSLSNVVGEATLGTDVVTTTIVDNDEPPPPPAGVTFAVGDASVSEGSAVTITITRGGNTAVAASVDVASLALGAGDTAEANDFTALAGQTVTFAAGETEKTITIQTTADDVYEGAETFRVGLSNAQATGAGASITDAEGTVTILDDGTGPDPDGDGPETPDDDKTSFSVDSVSVSEGGLMTFTVTRTGDAEADQTVDFATSIEAGDSAEADDFASATGTLTFAAGETSKTFTVQSTADNVYEGAETFTVTLSNNSAGSTISQATGTGTILDDGTGPDPDGPEGPETPDDDRPVVSISGPTSVDEDAGTVTYTISLSNASTESVSVDYASADVTAEAGSDYTASSGTVTFAAGETEKTVTVAITDDDVDESDEDYTVSLSNVVGEATLGTDVVTTTIVDNDTGPDFSGIGSWFFSGTADNGGISTITVNEDGNGATGNITDLGVQFNTGNKDGGGSGGTEELPDGAVIKLYIEIVDDTLLNADLTFDAYKNGTKVTGHSAAIEDIDGVSYIVVTMYPTDAAKANDLNFTLQIIATEDDVAGSGIMSIDISHATITLSEADGGGTYAFGDAIEDKDDVHIEYQDGDAPVAIDLDGDGVEYLGRDAGVVFTDQTSGESVNTAWVGPADGMLVIDANNSGTVDESREYVFTEWSDTAQTDMEAVAEVFDTNQNGVLDAQDEQWDQFAVWQDADSDGVTDEGELTSLTDLGIESIALNYAEDSESGTAADGDVVIHGQSEVVFTDGTTTTAEDTSFAISAADVISDEGDLALPSSEEAARVPGAPDAEADGRSDEFDTLMVEADLMLNANRDEGVDDSSNQ